MAQKSKVQSCRIRSENTQASRKRVREGRFDLSTEWFGGLVIVVGGFDAGPVELAVCATEANIVFYSTWDFGPGRKR